MGFLDRKSRVIDVTLTARGRQLLAAGELDFAYYAFFDDGIDHDPWSSGTLTETEREDLIHSTPLLEAWTVPDQVSEIPKLEPQNPVFGAVDGYSLVPRVLNPVTGSQEVVRCDQAFDGGTYLRTATSVASVRLRHSVDAIPGPFSIHVFSSGSGGLVELEPRYDLKGRRSLDPFVSVTLDEEGSTDRPAVNRPDSNRKGGPP